MNPINKRGGNVVPSPFASEFDTRKALYWKDPLLYAICCFRNKFILVVTYGKVPCFYFLEKALTLH